MKKVILTIVTVAMLFSCNTKTKTDSKTDTVEDIKTDTVVKVHQGLFAFCGALNKILTPPDSIKLRPGKQK